jgi:tagaturonate reductase
MQPLNSTTAPKTKRPERIIQFGEGNFLRGFVEWIVQQLNRQTDFDASVVVVKPRPGSLQQLLSQDCLYHVNLQGLSEGKPIDSLECIDCISRAVSPYDNYDDYLALADLPDLRFIVSNTTEAGISFDPTCRLTDTPPSSFPAKLTQLLYQRFRTFQGDPKKGVVILPCELIMDNGKCLAECIHRYISLWADDLMPDLLAFRRWFDQSCYVCTTLVDRIVPGFPQKDIEAINQRTGFDDQLVVRAEPYHLWVIQTAPNLPLESLARQFPTIPENLQIIFTTDESPYHLRKVTLLNGPHTVLSPVAFLAGLDIVRDACQHDIVGRFIHRVIYDELLPTLNLPTEELEQFAADVLQRFCNPFVDHQLTSIMLNSFPKYQTRDLPALKTYLKRRDTLPRGLVVGLAAICIYYRGGKRADGTPIQPNDDPQILQLLASLWASGDVHVVAEGVLAAKELIWHEHGDLNKIPGLTDALADEMQSILEHGILQTIDR